MFQGSVLRLGIFDVILSCLTSRLNHFLMNILELEWVMGFYGFDYDPKWKQ